MAIKVVHVEVLIGNQQPLVSLRCRQERLHGSSSVVTCVNFCFSLLPKDWIKTCLGLVHRTVASRFAISAQGINEQLPASGVTMTLIVP